MEVAIRCRDLRKTYDGKVEAVRGIDLEVCSGECFGLLGPNGAGKTTTIKMLTTLMPPDSGEVFICGHSLLTSPTRVRESIGYVPQMLSVDGSMTGFENLLIFSKLYGLKRTL